MSDIDLNLSPKQECSGFTLVELAIVLVIVGLIAGGILVGRDLIEAANIRAQISQMEKYKTAVTAFRLKYGGLPGDLLAGEAAGFGFETRSGAISHGDGNGILDSCTTVGVVFSDRNMGCETALFWSDMSKANLIEGTFDKATDDYVPTVTIEANTYLPSGQMGNNTYMAVFSEAVMDPLSIAQTPGCADSFCFALVGQVFIIGADGQISAGESVTPYQAYTIDTKMDDGKPRTGAVLAGSTGSSLGQGFTLYHIPSNPSNTRCTSSQTFASPENEYRHLDEAAANEVRCYMNFVYR